MFKGIVFCLCFLVVQLFTLSYIDHRVGQGESATRQAATAQNGSRQRESGTEEQA
ncbi:hypothetical protein [Salinicola sp. MIT1003]|uniref:hypothetical protein n=1 Tax=Salinicola sp. MIT1003 TaxID=1882734 RepID=UPI00147FB8FC|nr:hypothetical protein [Salinicola sp. MIT1003]